MSKYLIILCLLVVTEDLLAQRRRADGYIITNYNDTIYGQIKTKRYYRKRKVKVYISGEKQIFKKAEIKEIHFNNIKYIKSDYGIWHARFFKKIVEGPVNLYTYKSRKYLGAYDSDLNFDRLKPSLKFYCDNYPGFITEIRTVKKSNVADFIIKYNNWKLNNISNKSFFESNIHTKPYVSCKFLYFLPGAGLEIKLTEKISMNPMIKTQPGLILPFFVILEPYLENQLRFYHNIDRRKLENKRTYRFTGNYYSIVHRYYMLQNYNLIGFEYGWQRTVGKHWFYNLGIGAANSINFRNVYFIYDFSVGFIF